MSLNPITALRESIEKLIIEHGSAVIGEKHIALLKEQLAIAEKENAKLVAEIATFQSKLQILETDNQHLRKENEQLTNKIQAYEGPNHDALLEEIKVKILLFLHKHGDVFLDRLAQSLNIKTDIATMHLKELFSKDMVTTIAAGRSSKWHLQPKGTRYLVDHELIPQP